MAVKKASYIHHYGAVLMIWSKQKGDLTLFL